MNSTNGTNTLSAVAYAHQGETFRMTGYVEEACDAFDKAIAQNPNYAWAYAHRGATRIRLGDYYNALTDLNKPIEIYQAKKGPNAWVYAHQGETFRMTGYVEEACDAFDKAIAQNPNYAWAYAHRGATRSRLGDYDNALTDLNKAIELYQAKKGPNAWVYAHRGETYRLKYIRDRHRKWDQFLDEDFNNAIEDLTRAIELDPEYAWAYAHRAATYRLKLPEYGHKDEKWGQHWQNALNDFNQAIEQSNHTYAWAYAFRSTIYKIGGQYQKAFNDLMTALRIDIDSVKNPEAERAVLLLYYKKYKEARQNAERALENDPMNTWAVYCLAVSEAMIRSVEDAQVEINLARSVLQETISSALCSLAGLAALENDRRSARFFLAHATVFDDSYATDRVRNDPTLRKLKFSPEKDSSKYLECIKHFEQEVTKS
jgi:tetratricopeptide (TPR) repeat protein